LIRREADGTWPANSQKIGPEAALVLQSLEFSCPLAAIYEGTHLARAARG
jgi:hypothetical protein